MQGAYGTRPALRGRIAHDDEFLSLDAFRLEPAFLATGCIAGISQFRDNAFQAHAAGFRQHVRALPADVVAVVKEFGLS